MYGSSCSLVGPSEGYKREARKVDHTGRKLMVQTVEGQMAVQLELAEQEVEECSFVAGLVESCIDPVADPVEMGTGRHRFERG
jgi:hypothetical protein